MNWNPRRWPKFARNTRNGNEQLLKQLDKYSESICISGCQRSGGTMLADAFCQHPDIVDFTWTDDAELDAAKILSGAVDREINTGVEASRFCFQTTYLNERYVEYADHIDSSYLIWLIRNPYSVVYSMLYNWSRFALNEVFTSCGLPNADREVQEKYQRLGIWGISRLERACYAYVGKSKQCLELANTLPSNRYLIVEYDSLVASQAETMSQLMKFTNLCSSTKLESKINTNSLNKAQRLKDSERETIHRICDASYKATRKLLTPAA